MRLIIMRHGQTAWNVEHRIQGHTDIPLDERGKQQAMAIAERLGCMKIDAVYSSPLQRAYMTGSYIAEKNHCKLIGDERLIERYFGDWEGLRMEDAEDEYPDIWRTWIRTPETCEVPKGEMLRDVLKRSLLCSEEIIKKHMDANVVIVSHANPAKLLLMHYTGIPLNRIHSIRTDNCSYSELYMQNGKFVLATLNETTFLRERGLL